MENQHNNNKLIDLRGQIDQIDNQIITLLNQRMGIVAKVGELKRSNGEKFFIKSAREADMIKNLIEKAHENQESSPLIPKSVIVSIWRKIITSANNLEQEIKIAFHNPGQKYNSCHHILREYYADFIPIHDYSSSTNTIAAIEKNSAQIGIFTLSDMENKNDDLDHWWINMAASQSGLKVFAKIPFIHYQKNHGEITEDLFAVAIKNAEKSLDDKSLLLVELDKEFSSHLLAKSFTNVGLKAKIIKQAKIKEIRNINFYLVEIEGFFEAEDEKIKSLSKSRIKPHVKIIGHYPTPILL